jgi:cytochrome P450
MTGIARGCPVLADYDPLDPADLRDPFPGFERTRATPVFFNERTGWHEVTRYEDIVAILHDSKRFSNKMTMPIPLPPEELRDRMPVFPHTTAVAFLDEPEHKPARAMIQAPFTPRRLRTMAPLIAQTARRLLRPEDPDRHLEVVLGFANPLAITVIGDLLGITDQDFPILRRSITGINHIASGACTDEEFHRLALEQVEYLDFLRDLVEARRRAPRDDFASVLATYRNEDGTAPTTDEIAAHINTILGAGFDTTAQQISAGLRSLFEAPDQWELLKADRSLLPTAVEECTRHRGAIKRLFRVVLEDVAIGGVPIPAGALLCLSVGSSTRDPAHYDAPDRFDITRRRDNLTFGRGLHFCVGAPLAKLELKATLEALLDLAPEARLLDADFDPLPDLRMTMMTELHLDLGPVPA